MKLKVKRILADAKLPEVAHPTEDFGYDVFACIDGGDNALLEPEWRTIAIKPGKQALISIGWAMEMESYVPWQKVGFIAKQPSGMALKRMLDVKAGVIDAGYRNEVKILLYNYGTETQFIKQHDKIAQLVPALVLTGVVNEVEELSDSDRGLNGWGSGAKK